MTTIEAREAAARLARALRRDEPYRLLDRAAPGCGFGDGGCRVLAEALRRVLGGALYAVYRDDGLVDHVSLQVGGAYLDADGRHTRRQLLGAARAAGAGRSGVRLRRCRGEVADAAGIPYDEGPPPPWRRTSGADSPRG